jgi:hypothetical protein
MPKHEELYFTPHLDKPHQKWSILEDPECPSAGTIRRHYRQSGEKPDVKRSFGISEVRPVLEYYAARAGIEYSRVSLGRQTFSFDLAMTLLWSPLGMETSDGQIWRPVIPWVRDDGFCAVLMREPIPYRMRKLAICLDLTSRPPSRVSRRGSRGTWLEDGPYYSEGKPKSVS